jgi:glucose-6-phosphate 1-dehydrogenase
MKTQLVIFGITGDLAGRKLLPALDSIIKTGNYDDLSIIGVSRREVSVNDIVGEYPTLTPRTDLFTMNLAEVGDYTKLKAFLEAQEADQTLFYLSVPPGAAADIVDFLGEAGLNSARYKVLFEKPFGYDLASAEEFIARTGRYFAEDQIYRIDHYMAKEIAAEVLRVRRDAENHHHTWGNNSIKRVSVVATEKIGIEGRAEFYQQTGALRDFVQGHLMQLLSLVLIDKPGTRSLPEERLAALELIQPADPRKAIRAQYEGYSNEVGQPNTTVETFVGLELESRDPSWRGVTLQLVTGKSLSEKRSYIEIEYVDGMKDVFEEGKIVPENGRTLDAYERLLLAAIASEKDIFTTSSEVVRSWQIVAPVQKAWSMDDAIDLYRPGSRITLKNSVEIDV